MKTQSETIPHFKPLPNGLHAYLAIQCVCPDTGETGCFLFSGKSHMNKGSRCTPVYGDLVDLFTAICSDWQEIGGEYLYNGGAGVVVPSN